MLRIDGTCGREDGEFRIAVGEGARVRHRIQTGLELCGSSVPDEDSHKETAEFYKTSGLNVEKNPEG